MINNKKSLHVPKEPNLVNELKLKRKRRVKEWNEMEDNTGVYKKKSILIEWGNK